MRRKSEAAGKQSNLFVGSVEISRRARVKVPLYSCRWEVYVPGWMG